MNYLKGRRKGKGKGKGNGKKGETTTKEKERAKEEESKETTTKTKEKDTTKEAKRTTKVPHGAHHGTTKGDHLTTTKDKEEEQEKEESLLQLRDTYSSTIQKGEVAEPLLFHDKHFYVEALVPPQNHNLNYLRLHYLQSKLFRDTTMTYYTTGDGEVHEQTGEAQLPKSNKPPQLPTEDERLIHELTHQPY